MMTPDSLSQVATRLADMNLHLQTRIGSATGHLGIQAAEVADLFAREIAQGGKVIVGFRTNVGTQLFALSPEHAQQLRVNVQTAEESAQKLASQSRN
jgi:hypothetical protein